MIGVLKRKRCLFDWKVSNSSCNRAPAWAEVSSSFKIQTTSRKSISRGRNSLWTLSPITATMELFNSFETSFSTTQSKSSQQENYKWFQVGKPKQQGALQQ